MKQTVRACAVFLLATGIVIGTRGAGSATASAPFTGELAGVKLGMTQQQVDTILAKRNLAGNGQPTQFYEDLPDGSRGPLKAYGYNENVGTVLFEVSIHFSRFTHKVMNVTYTMSPDSAQRPDLLAAAKAKYGAPHDVVVIDHRQVGFPHIHHPFVWGDFDSRYLELADGYSGQPVLTLEDVSADKRDATWAPPGSGPVVPKL